MVRPSRRGRMAAPLTGNVGTRTEDTDNVEWDRGPYTPPGSESIALDDLTDVTITSPAVGDRLRYNGTAWVNSTAMWVPVMVEDGATGLWYVAVTGDGDAVMTEVP